MPETVENIKDEKEKLDRKVKSMAKIIEELSSSDEPASLPEKAASSQSSDVLKELDEKLTTQLKNLEGNISGIERKLEKSSKGKGISGIIKKEMDDRLGKIEDQIKDIGKINDLDEQMKNISASISAISMKKSPEDGELEKYEKDLILKSADNAAKGEIEALKNSIELLKRKTEKIEDTPERVRKVIEALYSQFVESKESIAQLKDKLTKIEDFMNPQYIDKMRNFIKTGEDVITLQVQEEFNKRTTVFLRDIKELRAEVNKIEHQMSDFSGQIKYVQERAKQINSLEKNIEDVQRGLEKTHEYAERENRRTRERLNNAISDISGKAETLDMRVKDIETSQKASREITRKNVREMLPEFTDPKIAEIENAFDSRLNSKVSGAENSAKQALSDVDQLRKELKSMQKTTIDYGWIKTHKEEDEQRMHELRKIFETEMDELRRRVAYLGADYENRSKELSEHKSRLETETKTQNKRIQMLLKELEN